MSAWGKTGRVRLTAGADPDVKVDGVWAGWVGKRLEGWNAAAECDMAGATRLPSLDAAVLWVLRRVDPALWRQERGAWLVRKRKPGEGIADGWFFRGPREFNPAFPWLIVDPGGVSRDAAADMPTARRYAEMYAAHPEAVSA